MDTEKIVKYIVAGVVGFVLLLAVIGSFQVIRPGNIGVVFNTISGSLYSVDQGVTFKVPFVTTVESYPVALRTYTLIAGDALDLPTKEGQHIKQDLSVTYNTSRDQAVFVFKSFRGAPIEEIESTFIRRTIITVAQNASGTMSLTDIISSGRDSLQETIQKQLDEEFKKMGFQIDKINLGASHLPENIETAMQDKMSAQQEAQKAQFQYEKEQMLAKAAVATAEGTANALLVVANAQAKANKLLQDSLTPLLVKNKMIEKWNGILPKVSGNATPIIDMRAE